MDRRREAAALFARGVTRAAAARTLGVSRSTTTRWHRAWRAGALLRVRIPGRAPKLGAADWAAVDRALARSPRAAGFDLDAWSLAAAAALIEARTGVRYHRRHVGRVLRRMGWVVPPVGRAAAAGMRRRAAFDPDGNPLLLLQGRGGSGA